MSFLGSLRTWLLFNNKIIPQKYNLPNNSALPVDNTALITIIICWKTYLSFLLIYHR